MPYMYRLSRQLPCNIHEHIRLPKGRTHCNRISNHRSWRFFVAKIFPPVPCTNIFTAPRNGRLDRLKLCCIHLPRSLWRLQYCRKARRTVQTLYASYTPILGSLFTLPVFCDVSQCSLVETNVSDERAATIFRFGWLMSITELHGVTSQMNCRKN